MIDTVLLGSEVDKECKGGTCCDCEICVGGGQI